MGAALLIASGYTAGAHQRSLKSSGLDAFVGENILTATQWATDYQKAIKGVSCADVLQSNSNIMQGSEPKLGVNLALQLPLEKWYRDNKAAKANTALLAAQQAMQTGIDQCVAVKTTPTSSSTAKTSEVSPSSVISSYSEFGTLYSRETRGKSW